MDKTFVFGDIHGCQNLLESLMIKISPSREKDTLIFLGDYINRGPNSKEVISKILVIKKKFQNVITLMGNHEQIFLDFLRGENKKLFLNMGGEKTLKSYGISLPWSSPRVNLIPPDHLAFFKELLLSWEDDANIYVHGGLQPGTHLSQQPIEWLLWAREKFIHTKHNYGKRVIYGHTPFQEPRIDPNKIGIDTGAVYGGKLTCLVLPDLKFFQAAI